MSESGKNALLPVKVDTLQLGRNGRALLDRLSCEIDSPGITVIMGPNGAGKSLFLRCLHGLEQANSGTVTFGGTLLDEEVRKRQSLVFQTPVLLRRTVAQNLAFAGGMHGPCDTQLIDEMLSLVGLLDLRHQPAPRLSGGEKQRLAVARALITRPGLLLLDEACANLDPASVHQIESIITTAAAGGTKIILVTHDTGQAKRLASDVLFLNKGRLCEHTRAADFFSRPASDEARLYLGGMLLL